MSRSTTACSGTYFRFWLPTVPGASLLLSWHTKMPRGNSGPRGPATAVMPSVRSQSSEFGPDTIRNDFTQAPVTRS